jgi:hypothetical protein
VTRPVRRDRPERAFTEREFREVIDRAVRPAESPSEQGRYKADEIAAAARELGAEPRAIDEAIAAVTATTAVTSRVSRPAKTRKPRASEDISKAFRPLAGMLFVLSLGALSISFAVSWLQDIPAFDAGPMPWDHLMGSLAVVTPAIKVIAVVSLVLAGLLYTFGE